MSILLERQQLQFCKSYPFAKTSPIHLPEEYKETIPAPTSNGDKEDPVEG
jgi:hypothetical protein